MPVVCTFHHDFSAGVLTARMSDATKREKHRAVIASSIASGCRFVHEDFSAFHDEDDAAYGGDVLTRIAIESDDVCVEARSDGASAVLYTECFGSERVGGD